MPASYKFSTEYNGSKCRDALTGVIINFPMIQDVPLTDADYYHRHLTDDWTCQKRSCCHPDGAGKGCKCCMRAKEALQNYESNEAC